MTREEYFNLLVKTSQEGLFPSLNGENCAYRSVEGRRCAIGLIIEDAEYQDSFERRTIASICSFHPKLEDLLVNRTGCSLDELSQIQKSHDAPGNKIGEERQSGWDHDLFVSRLKEEVFKEIK